MKKNLAYLIATLLILGCLHTTFANNNEEDNTKGYISVSTKAETEVAPDTAEISFEIKTTDTKSMQKASLLNKDLSEKVYNLLEEQINPANGDYIKTTNYNAVPVYNYSNSKKTFDRYEVSNRIIVRTKYIDRLGGMIDKATEAGVTNIDSLKFSVSNYEKQCNSLIETATKKANARAVIAAKSAGTSIIGIRSMNISCSDNSSYGTPRLYMAKNMVSSVAEDMDSTVSGTNISGGTIKIYSNVNASFFVK